MKKGAKSKKLPTYHQNTLCYVAWRSPTAFDCNSHWP